MGRKKRVLVAGGAGFIGANLVRRLLDGGCAVTVIDNFSTGRKTNLADLVRAKRITLIQEDIRNPWLEYVGDVDEIYNLACPASPPKYQRDPVATLYTSVLGTGRLLDMARYMRARFLQASTSEVYGEPLAHPQPESYRGNVNTVGPRACYDEGKRAAETLCYEYHRQFGVNVKIVRIFNTYGPWMDPTDGRVVSNFICQALRGEDITVYGDGTQTRSFQYVSDLIDGFLAMMNTPDGDIGPVNIGNPSEFTIAELADLVVRLTGSKSKIVFRDLPADDPTQRRPDIDRAKRDLGWEPRVHLEEGLIKTIDYFKKELYG